MPHPSQRRTIMKRDKYNNLHCEDGPALAYGNGDEYWYNHGDFHRIGGPAVTRSIESKMRYEYWVDGNRHREDGPAVIYGTGIGVYFLNGVRLSESEYYRELFNRGLITEQELFLKLL